MPVKVQRFIAILSVVLFAGKLWAWYITHSVAIFTDALESIVNIVTGFIGLYSVHLAAKPRDSNHPFGHGKIEFIASGMEGVLIILAGIFICYQAVYHLLYPRPLHQLDLGIVIIAAAGLLNLLAGIYAIRKGRQYKSATIEAAGYHIRADAWSTFAILIGLGLLMLTGWQWLDSAVAIVFAVFIIFTGYKVLRKSFSGIMDESDEQLLEEVIGFIQQHRRPQWIDMHNVRVLQYGSVLHVDAHMTLPWYFHVREGEKEIHAVENLVAQQYGHKIEMFIHIDGCVPTSCKLCALHQCAVRTSPFQHTVNWNAANVWIDAKHQ